MANECFDRAAAGQIPEPQRLVRTARQRSLAVRCNGNRGDPVRIPAPESFNLAAAGQIPKYEFQDADITATGQCGLAVRRKGYRGNPVRMPLEFLDFAATGQIPEPQRLVLAPRQRR